MIVKKTTTEDNLVRIIIVDDHPLIREGLRALLSREASFEICGDVGTTAEAMALINSGRPHLVIADVLLEDENGLDLIRRIKGLGRGIRILACSMHDDLLYAQRALASGAMGYINKRAGISKIIDAIRMVMAGEVFLTERMKRHIISRNSASGSIRNETPIEMLSNREIEIFRLIGYGMTTSEIGRLLKLSIKTTERHRRHISGHLQLDNTHQLTREAAQWALENG